MINIQDFVTGQRKILFTLTGKGSIITKNREFHDKKYIMLKGVKGVLFEKKCLQPLQNGKYLLCEYIFI